MAANDYYDFNPSPGTWALMLTVMVLFVLAISVLLIYLVDRGQVTSGTAEAVSPPDELAVRKHPAPGLDTPSAEAS
jgi:hypothetical protein